MTAVTAHRPTVKRRTYLIREPVIYVPIVLAALFALLAPVDILDRLPWLKPFTGAMREWLPFVDAYTNKSAFPQVTEVYFAVMAVHALVHASYAYAECREAFVRGKKKWMQASGWRKLLGVFVMFLMFPAFVVFMVVINPGMDLRWMPINTGRWALGAFGWIFSGACVVMLAVVPISWFNALFSKDQLT